MRHVRGVVAPGLLVMTVVGVVWPGLARAQQGSDESCAACHGGIPDERLSAPVEGWSEDIHAARGFGCVACHGGDGQEESLDAMDPEKGYIGVPTARQVPEVCGRCHSDARFMRRYNPSIRVDQVAEYRTSVHGQRLFELGDTAVATCSDCHTPHSIKPASDPASSVHPPRVAVTCGSCHADSSHMAGYGIPTDQLKGYTSSVHWEMMSVEGDLSAPTCNDCHGNHGAAPPGVSWVGNVCGQCHSVMAELFNASFHSEIFRLLGSPGCATCHGNHAIVRANDELLGLGEGAVCSGCHGAGDRGGQVAAEMRALIDSLQMRRRQADSILARAENAGMEVSEAQFQLGDVTSALVRTRTAVHSFVADSVRSKVEDGLAIAEQARTRGIEALEELQFRRMGLAVSTVIILLLILGLVLKIRELG